MATWDGATTAPLVRAGLRAARTGGALVYAGVTMYPLRTLVAAGLRVAAARLDGAPTRPALLAYPDPDTETYHVTVFTEFGRVCANLPMS